MKETLVINKNQIEEIKYLKEGEQTKFSPQIRKIGEKIKSEAGNFEEQVRRICDFVKALKYNKEGKMKIFRKRTADEIISSGFVTGCTDAALVFIVIARSMGIPTKYIETINSTFFTGNEKERANYSGHVYAGVLEKGKGLMRVVDVKKKDMNANPEKDGRVVYGEGLDSWDLGITDFETLKNKFDEYRASIR